ncbi:hypothetical protein M422DRAFT_261054 [Sphaerobolus stellatus SS14]|uniref:CCHC-type domain-containing protein n=1 Tax=Sphaerobolus stellatus (strain SS14) TaxID=990650 RepID=A0A0C9V445_SPHS4|nr:hypothetical protein M422DRAFT_261054 [Sphaerobolus stellatus SS14]
MELRVNGTLAVKKLDWQDERAIREGPWQAASKLAVDLARQHWPQREIRADALSKHHSIVTEIADSHSWQIAVAYNIRQREIMHRTPQHDVSQFNEVILSIVTSQVLGESVAALRSQQYSQMSSVYNILPKRSAPIDFQGTPSSQKHPRVKKGCCFRCGYYGHLPTECKAEKMTASKATALVVPSKTDGVPVDLKTPATTFIFAPSVERRDMELDHVAIGSDPRRVVTPLKADKIERVLRTFNVLDDWQHIVHGVRFGFDVGASIPPNSTHLFRKS